MKSNSIRALAQVCVILRKSYRILQINRPKSRNKNDWGLQLFRWLRCQNCDERLWDELGSESIFMLNLVCFAGTLYPQSIYLLMSLRIQDINHFIGIDTSWEVSEITQDRELMKAELHVTYSKDLVLRCPECGKACPGYDHRRRKWCHTMICDYQTKVVANVPRVKCSEHGIKTVSVPWAEARMQCTFGFEARAID